jgi:two-component system response regulator
MNQKFILLVEDNPDDEALTLRALRKNNILNEVIVVRDGVEALDFLFCNGVYSGRPAHEMPALVLLDLKLPKIDGLEVLRQVRAQETTCRLPVVVLTSSREEGDISNSYKLGASSYIVKPVDFMKFMEIIRTIGLYWLSMNEPPPGL